MLCVQSVLCVFRFTDSAQSAEYDDEINNVTAIGQHFGWFVCCVFDLNELCVHVYFVKDFRIVILVALDFLIYGLLVYGQMLLMMCLVFWLITPVLRMSILQGISRWDRNYNQWE